MRLINFFKTPKAKHVCDLLVVETFKGNYYVDKCRYDPKVQGMLVSKMEFEELLAHSIRPIVLHEEYIDLQL